MERKDYLDRLAPCGLHCGECFAFKDGHIHRSARELREFLGNFEPYAKRFSARFEPKFDNYPAFVELLDYLAEVECTGCRNEECRFYANCRVRHCVEETGVDFCCDCPEFPCQKTGLDDNLYQRHVAHNRRIQEIGMEAYYDEVKGKSRY